MQDAVTALNDGGKTCVHARSAATEQVFTNKTLSSIWNADDCAKVILMNYDKDDAPVAHANLNVWSYALNNHGKGSETKKFRVQATEQLAKVKAASAQKFANYHANTYGWGSNVSKRC